jgi:hypothetical protein
MMTQFQVLLPYGVSRDEERMGRCVILQNITEVLEENASFFFSVFRLYGVK